MHWQSNSLSEIRTGSAFRFRVQAGSAQTTGVAPALTLEGFAAVPPSIRWRSGCSDLYHKSFATLLLSRDTFWSLASLLRPCACLRPKCSWTLGDLCVPRRPARPYLPQPHTKACRATATGLAAPLSHWPIVQDAPSRRAFCPAISWLGFLSLTVLLKGHGLHPDVPPIPVLDAVDNKHPPSSQAPSPPILSHTKR